MSRKAVDTRKRNKVGTRMMYGRLLIVYGAILLLCGGLVGRIVWLNQEKGDNYEKKVLAQQSYVSNEIPYRRGDITDRNGNKLATSKKVYNLILDPQLMLSDEEFPEPTKEALQQVFGLKESRVEKILEKYPDSRYYVVEKYKGISKDKVEAFNALEKENRKIKGVWFEEEYIRKYPYSTVGSSVIGFCSTDNNGVWGIENQYNSSLNGSYGRKYGYFDSDLNLVQTVKEAANGNTVISTIDVNVQGILEQHMERFQKETGSENMGCIIMNPKNGEIYAMSSYPVYDLNQPMDLGAFYTEEELAKMSDKKKMEKLNEIWRNFCISDSYEPGSTFKPITVSAGLDEGVTSAGKTYVCDGVQDVGGAHIKCVAYSRGGHGNINICQSLMESCNDVMMHLVSDLGKAKFLDYVKSFGFGKKTGIDLPGEATGSIFTTDTMHSTEMATSSFGQSQTTTMIQMAAAFSAVINGGDYFEPHVVKEVQSESGATVESRDDTLVRKVITEDTSKMLREYLYKTVEEGTAAPAQVSGYEIGGKTGTAEKYPRNKKNYLVSFIGFTPVDDPEVVIYTVIDQPHVEDQAHSIYATEFSSAVMKDVLPLLGIYKQQSGKKSDAEEKDSDKLDIKLPSTKNGNLFEEVPEGGYSDSDYSVAEAPKEENQ